MISSERAWDPFLPLYCDNTSTLRYFIHVLHGKGKSQSVGPAFCFAERSSLSWCYIIVPIRSDLPKRAIIIQCNTLQHNIIHSPTTNCSTRVVRMVARARLQPPLAATSSSRVPDAALACPSVAKGTSPGEGIPCMSVHPRAKFSRAKEIINYQRLPWVSEIH